MLHALFIHTSRNSLLLITACRMRYPAAALTRLDLLPTLCTEANNRSRTQGSARESSRDRSSWTLTRLLARRRLRTAAILHHPFIHTTPSPNASPRRKIDCSLTAWHPRPPLTPPLLPYAPDCDEGQKSVQAGSRAYHSVHSAARGYAAVPPSCPHTLHTPLGHRSQQTTHSPEHCTYRRAWIAWLAPSMAASRG